MRVRFYLFCLQQTPALAGRSSAKGPSLRKRMALPGPPGRKPPIRPSPHGGFAGEISRRPLSAWQPNEGRYGGYAVTPRRRFNPVRNPQLGVLVTESGMFG